MARKDRSPKHWEKEINEKNIKGISAEPVKI